MGGSVNPASSPSMLTAWPDTSSVAASPKAGKLTVCSCERLLFISTAAASSPLFLVKPKTSSPHENGEKSPSVKSGSCFLSDMALRYMTPVSGSSRPHGKAARFPGSE